MFLLLLSNSVFRAPVLYGPLVSQCHGPVEAVSTTRKAVKTEKRPKSQRLRLLHLASLVRAKNERI